MGTTADLRTDCYSPPPIPREVPRACDAPNLRRPEHYYVGRRPHGTEVYVVSRTAIEPLEHHGYRCGAPFDWGAPNRGALELAYAMLAHSTDSRPPDPICMTFWTEVVARLDRPGFVLGHDEIALWLLTAFCDGDEPPRKRGWSVRERLGRIRRWGRGR
jgi:hypothetical protein